MKFDRELAIGLFDFLIARATFHAENLVIIALGHQNEKLKVKAAKSGSCEARTLKFSMFILDFRQAFLRR
jgi:hypothetical protein